MEIILQQPRQIFTIPTQAKKARPSDICQKLCVKTHALHLAGAYAVSADSAGEVYVVDRYNHRIRKVERDFPNAMIIAIDDIDFASGIGRDSVSASKVKRVSFDTRLLANVAGTGFFGFSGDNGPATAAALSGPLGIFADSTRSFYFSDSNNHRVRRVSNISVVTTVAGTGSAGFFGDGGPPTACGLFNPAGLWADSLGNLFISDRGNNRIRLISVKTGTIESIAGTGDATFTGDGGLALSASLNSPLALWGVPNRRKVFVTDSDNNRVRELFKALPTQAPTVFSPPTYKPSVVPSLAPSNTWMPTTHRPSVMPTPQRPSFAPTLVPSFQPSCVPTGPSMTPTYPLCPIPVKTSTAIYSELMGGDAADILIVRRLGLVSALTDSDGRSMMTIEVTLYDQSSALNLATVYSGFVQVYCAAYTMDEGEEVGFPSTVYDIVRHQYSTIYELSPDVSEALERVMEYRVNVTIRDLDAATRHRVFCVIVSDLGNVISSYDEAISSSLSSSSSSSLSTSISSNYSSSAMTATGNIFTSPCCKLVSVDMSALSYVLATDELFVEYDAVALSLSARPSDDLQVLLSLRPLNSSRPHNELYDDDDDVLTSALWEVSSTANRSNSTAADNSTLSSLPVTTEMTEYFFPSLHSFSSTAFTQFSTRSTSHFVSGSPEMIGSSNLLSTTGGETYYKLIVSLSGPSASEYRVVFPSGETMSVVRTGTSIRAPSLREAAFSPDGSHVKVSFDMATDRGLSSLSFVPSSFKCNSVLNFTGCEDADCSWMDDMSIAVRQHSGVTSLRTGGRISLSSEAHIQALCKTCQSGVASLDSMIQTDPSAAVEVSGPSNASLLLPSVNYMMPDLIEEGVDLVVDISGSEGSAGRDWSRVDIRLLDNGVYCPHSDTQSYLIENFVVNPPMAIPSKLLSVGHTYSFLVTLCNDFNACNQRISAVTIASMNETATPASSVIRGRNFVSMAVNRTKPKLFISQCVSSRNLCDQSLFDVRSELSRDGGDGGVRATRQLLRVPARITATSVSDNSINNGQWERHTIVARQQQWRLYGLHGAQRILLDDRYVSSTSYSSYSLNVQPIVSSFLSAITAINPTISSSIRSTDLLTLELQFSSEAVVLYSDSTIAISNTTNTMNYLVANNSSGESALSDRSVWSNRSIWLFAEQDSTVVVAIIDGSRQRHVTFNSTLDISAANSYYTGAINASDNFDNESGDALLFYWRCEIIEPISVFRVISSPSGKQQLVQELCPVLVRTKISKNVTLFLPLSNEWETILSTDESDSHQLWTRTDSLHLLFSDPLATADNNSTTIPSNSTTIRIHVLAVHTLSRRESTSSIDITIAAEPSSEATISTDGITSTSNLWKVNINQSLTLFGDIKVQFHDCDAEWAWSLENVQPLSGITSTRTTTLLSVEDLSWTFNLGLRANVLFPGQSMTFWLQCNEAVVSEIIVSTNDVPTPGHVSVSPTSGTELLTQFTWSAHFWTDPDLPLSYEFGVRSTTSKVTHTGSSSVVYSSTQSSYFALQRRSENQYGRVILPLSQAYVDSVREAEETVPTICVLRVYDSYQSSTESTQSINLEPFESTISRKEAIDELLFSLSVIEDTADMDRLRETLTALSSAINLLGCNLSSSFFNSTYTISTSSPISSSYSSCFQLNRVVCGVVDGVCGHCFSGHSAVEGVDEYGNTLCAVSESLISTATRRKMDSSLDIQHATSEKRGFPSILKQNHQSGHINQGVKRLGRGDFSLKLFSLRNCTSDQDCANTDTGTVRDDITADTDAFWYYCRVVAADSDSASSGGTCATRQKRMHCANNGVSMAFDVHTGKNKGSGDYSCAIDDTSCDAVCVCDRSASFSGPLCEMSIDELASRQSYRHALISLLNNSMHNSIAEESGEGMPVEYWARAFNAAAMRPHEVSGDDLLSLVEMSASIFHWAFKEKLQYSISVVEMLSALDTIFSLKSANYFVTPLTTSPFETISVWTTKASDDLIVWPFNSADSIRRSVGLYSWLLSKHMTVGEYTVENINTYQSFSFSSVSIPVHFAPRVGLSGSLARSRMQQWAAESVGYDDEDAGVDAQAFINVSYVSSKSDVSGRNIEALHAVNTAGMLLQAYCLLVVKAMFLGDTTNIMSNPVVIADGQAESQFGLPKEVAAIVARDDEKDENDDQQQQRSVLDLMGISIEMMRVNSEARTAHLIRCENRSIAGSFTCTGSGQEFYYDCNNGQPGRLYVFHCPTISGDNYQCSNAISSIMSTSHSSSSSAQSPLTLQQATSSCIAGRGASNAQYTMCDCFKTLDNNKSTDVSHLLSSVLLVGASYDPLTVQESSLDSEEIIYNPPVLIGSIFAVLLVFPFLFSSLWRKVYSKNGVNESKSKKNLQKVRPQKIDNDSSNSCTRRLGKTEKSPERWDRNALLSFQRYFDFVVPVWYGHRLSRRQSFLLWASSHPYLSWATGAYERKSSYLVRTLSRNGFLPALPPWCNDQQDVGATAETHRASQAAYIATADAGNTDWTFWRHTQLACKHLAYMFWLVLLLNIQYPIRDYGNYCGSKQSFSSCLQRSSILDPSRQYCIWYTADDIFSSTVTFDFHRCRVNPELPSPSNVPYRVILSIIGLTLVLTIITEFIVERVFMIYRSSCASATISNSTRVAPIMPTAVAAADSRTAESFSSSHSLSTAEHIERRNVRNESFDDVEKQKKVDYVSPPHGVADVPPESDKRLLDNISDGSVTVAPSGVNYSAAAVSVNTSSAKVAVRWNQIRPHDRSWRPLIVPTSASQLLAAMETDYSRYKTHQHEVLQYELQKLLNTKRRRQLSLSRQHQSGSPPHWRRAKKSAFGSVVDTNGANTRSGSALLHWLWRAISHSREQLIVYSTRDIPTFDFLWGLAISPVATNTDSTHKNRPVWAQNVRVEHKQFVSSEILLSSFKVKRLEEELKGFGEEQINVFLLKMFISDLLGSQSACAKIMNIEFESKFPELVPFPQSATVRWALYASMMGVSAYSAVYFVITVCYATASWQHTLAVLLIVVLLIDSALIGSLEALVTGVIAPALVREGVSSLRHDVFQLLASMERSEYIGEEMSPKNRRRHLLHRAAAVTSHLSSSSSSSFSATSPVPVPAPAPQSSSLSSLKYLKQLNASPFLFPSVKLSVKYPHLLLSKIIFACRTRAPNLLNNHPKSPMLCNPQLLVLNTNSTRTDRQHSEMSAAGPAAWAAGYLNRTSLEYRLDTLVIHFMHCIVDLPIWKLKLLFRGFSTAASLGVAIVLGLTAQSMYASVQNTKSSQLIVLVIGAVVLISIAAVLWLCGKMYIESLVPRPMLRFPDYVDLPGIPRESDNEKEGVDSDGDYYEDWIDDEESRRSSALMKAGDNEGVHGVDDGNNNNNTNGDDEERKDSEKAPRDEPVRALGLHSDAWHAYDQAADTSWWRDPSNLLDVEGPQTSLWMEYEEEMRLMDEEAQTHRRRRRLELEGGVEEHQRRLPQQQQQQHEAETEEDVSGFGSNDHDALLPNGVNKWLKPHSPMELATGRSSSGSSESSFSSVSSHSSHSSSSSGISSSSASSSSSSSHEDDEEGRNIRGTDRRTTSFGTASSRRRKKMKSVRLPVKMTRRKESAALSSAAGSVKSPHVSCEQESSRASVAVPDQSPANFSILRTGGINEVSLHAKNSLLGASIPVDGIPFPKDSSSCGKVQPMPTETYSRASLKKTGSAVKQIQAKKVHSSVLSATTTSSSVRMQDQQMQRQLRQEDKKLREKFRQRIYQQKDTAAKMIHGSEQLSASATAMSQASSKHTHLLKVATSSQRKEKEEKSKRKQRGGDTKSDTGLTGARKDTAKNGDGERNTTTKLYDRNFWDHYDENGNYIGDGADAAADAAVADLDNCDGDDDHDDANHATMERRLYGDHGLSWWDKHMAENASYFDTSSSESDKERNASAPHKPQHQETPTTLEKSRRRRLRRHEDEEVWSSSSSSSSIGTAPSLPSSRSSENETCIAV